MPAEPLTLNQLLDRLHEILEHYPDWADRPVHILDMRDDKEKSVEDLVTDNLVTHVEIDSFNEQQGPVTSLLAWADCDESSR